MLPANDALREVSVDFNCYMQQKRLQGFYVVPNLLHEKVGISVVWHLCVQNKSILHDRIYEYTCKACVQAYQFSNVHLCIGQNMMLLLAF